MGLFSFLSNPKPKPTPNKSSFKKIKGGGKMPAGDWTRVTELLNVQGIQFRRSDALRWASLAFRAEKSGGSFGLLIEPEPENLHDPNALKVMGWCGGKNILLGYVDRVEAAKISERYPNVFIAAEFYSIYQSANDYLDIRFFLAVPKGTNARASVRVRKLFEHIKDELIVLDYVARADGHYNKLNGDILNRFAAERAKDLKISLVDDDVTDIKKWLKIQSPNSEDVAAAIDRIADVGRLAPNELWDLVEIIAQADGKITKKEKLLEEEIAKYIQNSFGIQSENQNLS